MKQEVKAIIKVLEKEMKAKASVWPRVKGMPDTFISFEHQKHYDTLKHLVSVLEYCSLTKWKQLQSEAMSNKSIVEASLFANEG